MDTYYNDQAKDVFDFMGVLSKENPKIAEGVKIMSAAVGEDKALSAKHKALIAVGISISIRCEGCIAVQMKSALAAGATPQEIMETIGVSIYMGGGPSVAYGDIAYKAMKEMM